MLRIINFWLLGAIFIILAQTLVFTKNISLSLRRLFIWIFKTLIRLLISQKGWMIIKLSIFWNYEMLVMYKGKLLNIQLITIGSFVNYFSDDDFIRVGLGRMGYSCRSYKKIISNCNLLEVVSKLEISFF